MIHHILTKRYGEPSVLRTECFEEHRWNPHDETRECILYMGEQDTGFPSPMLRDFYGQSIGGFLVQDSMRIATLTTKPIYGLYQIHELGERPEVQQALALDPDVHFFMDAANVWFYGEKAGRLYEFDSEFGELTNLGEVAQSIEELIDQWEEATPDPRRAS